MRGASILAIVLLACGGEDAADPLAVDTTSGPIRGFRQGDSRAWLGLPYAAPPVGALRWRPPAAAPTWTEVREAAAVGPQCPQDFGFSSGGGGEDCLYLNVWAPAEPPAAPAAVMVWFHGGAFIFGSGGDPYYRGEALAARHGVIVVTVNYRLGPLGFLAHPAIEGGNFGIADQVAALEWVRDNIAGFGGDPARVTVWGESAGGYSACVHYLSPRSRGLFSAVISQSGLCDGDGLRERTAAEARADGVTFATAAGCPGEGPDALACLRAMDAFALVEAGGTPPIAEQLPGGLYFQGDDPARWRPFIDGEHMPVSMHEALSSLEAPPLPLLLGTNRDEGTFFVWSVIARAVADETEYRDALIRRFGADDVDDIVALYPVASYRSANLALADVAGDAFFVCPARRTARLASASGAPVFLYAFEREPENGLIADGGVFHAAEIPFVFGIDEFPLGKVGAAGKPVSDTMMAMWTRFATERVPDASWPAFTAASDQHLRIDLSTASGSGHKAAKCDYWDLLWLTQGPANGGK